MPTALCGHALPYDSTGIRGNCKRCYTKLQRLVQQGETTWERLEAEGKSSPLAVPNHPLTGRGPRWVRPDPTETKEERQVMDLVLGTLSDEDIEEH